MEKAIQSRDWRAAKQFARGNIDEVSLRRAIS
jgi:hypothetical protein